MGAEKTEETSINAQKDLIPEQKIEQNLDQKLEEIEQSPAKRQKLEDDNNILLESQDSPLKPDDLADKIA